MSSSVHEQEQLNRRESQQPQVNANPNLLQTQNHILTHTYTGDIYYQLYTNSQFNNILYHQNLTQQQKKLGNIIDQYYQTYHFLIYFRYFGYFLFMASETYQFSFTNQQGNKVNEMTQKLSSHLQSYLKDYQTGAAYLIFILISVIQAFISVYLTTHFQQSLNLKRPKLVAQLWIDSMKILRSYLIFVMMIVVLRDNASFDNWTSVIGFLIVCISMTVQKLIKLIYFKQVINPNKTMLMKYISQINLQTANLVRRVSNSDDFSRGRTGP